LTEARPSYTDTPEVQMIVLTKPRPTEPCGYSEILPPLEESAKIARRLVGTALAAWHLEELTESGTLIVTELVANAVKHTDSRHIKVVISRPGERLVHIGVVDSARTLPAPASAGDNPLAASGRGLGIIDALARRWGTDLYRCGKQVWAELDGGPNA
jgi:serine/threonine-protein kinase RsbW